MGYKTHCPSCGKDNFWVTPDNGVGYCFNCAFRTASSTVKPPERYSNISQLRALYAMATYEYHKQLLNNEKAYQYCIQRGITPQEIVHYRLGYSDTGIVNNSYPSARQSGLFGRYGDFLAGRITFPYIVGREVTDIRGRLLERKTDKDDVYKSVYGSAYFRGADYPYNYDDIHKDGDFIVVCESEIKSIFSARCFPSVGIPGIMSIRSQLLYIPKPLVICFDSQVENCYDVFRAIARLVGKLPHKDVRVAMLPLRGEAKQDVDSFMVRYGEEEYKKVITSAKPYQQWRELVRL